MHRDRQTDELTDGWTCIDSHTELLVESSHRRLAAGLGVQCRCEAEISVHVDCRRPWSGWPPPPVPFPYMLLVHRTVFLYVYISPFALVSSLRWWAPIFSGIISYTFFGLEEVARQCEQPFGNEANSLPLDAMCRVVEISVAQALGDKPPALLKPDNRKRLR